MLSTSVIFPATIAYVPEVYVVFDTSGSMDEVALLAGLAEVSGLISQLGGKVKFCSVDCEASALQEVTDISQVKLVGGGGTDMRKGINLCLKDNNKASVIIVMTDGDTPWPSEPINNGRTKLIVCLVGTNSTPLDSVPSWAKGIKIEEEEVSTREENA